FQNTLGDSSKLHFTIVERKKNERIGIAGLLGIDYKNSHAELYITIGDKRFRGQGIADEVVQLLLEYGFLELGLNRIHLHTFTYNVRAQKVYERNGFVQEGILRQHSWKRGEYKDIANYGILKSEWLERNIK